MTVLILLFYHQVSSALAISLCTQSYKSQPIAVSGMGNTMGTGGGGKYPDQLKEVQMEETAKNCPTIRPFSPTKKVCLVDSKKVTNITRVKVLTGCC